MTSKYETESKGYTMITVMQEAARCLLCHDAPVHKPVQHILIRPNLFEAFFFVMSKGQLKRFGKTMR